FPYSPKHVSGMALLEVTNLGVGYETKSQRALVGAVRNVTFSLEHQEVFGIVGESGSGKSTLAQAAIGYVPSGGSVTSGSVRFDGIPLLECSKAKLRSIWGRRIAMVHQNPLSSLTPTMRVGDQVAEAVRAHRNVGTREAKRLAAASLADVH